MNYVKQNSVVKLTVGCKKDELFGSNVHYVIPIYQRDFAWEDEEILSLLQDIQDFKESEYFLGSLIVSPRTEEDNFFEVIDGQQRLTALYLIFNSLTKFLKSNKDIIDFTRNRKSLLSYEYRKRTIEDFRTIFEAPLGIIKPKQNEKNSAVVDAYNIIHNFLNENDIIHFVEKLKKTKLFRIEIPEGTNLNQYYERMNTRAEQLEPTDIVKARLMSHITSGKQVVEHFAQIWTACSDMNRYVQMSFDPGKGDSNELTRNNLFKDSWNCLNAAKLHEILHPDTVNESSILKDDDYPTVDKILGEKRNSDQKNSSGDDPGNSADNQRFESIISFPVFLIHALKIFSRHHVSHLDKDEIEKKLQDLDDTKLVEMFFKTVRISENDQVIEFIECLLKLRFLFDQYFLKRDYQEKGNSNKSSKDGKWEIQTLQSSSNKTAYYIQTDSSSNKQNVMIQSCLRVAYTAPRSMHWITQLLNSLYTEYLANQNNLTGAENQEISTSINCEALVRKAEKIAASAVQKDFLNLIKNPEIEHPYSMGVMTPHIVFHFLDYLIWKNNTSKFEDFEFQFRNSVEHWHPQNDKTTCGDQ